MIPVGVVLVAAHVAKDTPALQKLLNTATIAGGVLAISSMVVIAWTKLRLDRVWGWFTRHIKEDQALARKAEFLSVMQSTEMTKPIQERLHEVVVQEVVPQLAVINKRIDDHMEREEAALQDSADHIGAINLAVTAIAEEQRRVADNLVGANNLIAQHIQDDATFQSRVEPFLTEKTDEAKAI